MKLFKRASIKSFEQEPKTNMKHFESLPESVPVTRHGLVRGALAKQAAGKFDTQTGSFIGPKNPTDAGVIMPSEYRKIISEAGVKVAEHEQYVAQELASTTKEAGRLALQSTEELSLVDIQRQLHS